MKLLNIITRILLGILFLCSVSASAQTSFRNLTFSILRNPEPGYYLVEPNASDSVGFVDNSGRSVTKTFVGIHSNVQVYNDKYLTHFASIANGDPFFLRRDRFLNVIDTLRPVNGYFVDFHEGKVWSDSSYIVLATENRVMDLSGVVTGGSPSATIIGAVIQERRFSDGALLFEWKSLDHIPVTDVTDDIKLTDNLIDYIHVNSVAKDTDGNLIVSCRHTDEVIKIRKSSGQVMWRLGGTSSKGNQFTIVNDTYNNYSGFSHQHSALRTKSGNILLFDNGNLRPVPNYARVVEYEVDTIAMTATRVWTWQPPLGVIASSQGSVQELDGGNILIGWGSGSDLYVAHEVRRDGTIEAEIKNESGSGLIPYRVSKMRLGLTGIRKSIATTGTHTFSDGDSTTHVRLSLMKATDTTSIVVERHHYAPHAINFVGEAVCGVLPLRWTLRIREPQNVNGSIVFDLGSIPAIQFPELAHLYHRPVEGQGAFTRLAGTYSDAQKTFTTAGLINGEYLVGYADCLEPSPVEPFHQAVEVSTTPKLTWSSAVAATSYDVQVSTSATFAPLLFSQTTANLDVVLPNVQESTTLFWRVRKRTAAVVGPWSAPFRFTVVMGIPQLLSPVMEDDTVAVLETSEFRWIPGIGVPKSRLQIIGVASKLVVLDTIVDQPVFIPGSRLRPNTFYAWSVRGWADNVNGRPSTSETFITAVAAPRLRGPGANVVGVPPIKTTFIWDSVAGATSYRLIIRKAGDTSVVAIHDVNEPTFVVRNLPSSTKLSWTVRGTNVYGSGPYATQSLFTTASSSNLPAPTTVSPRGGVTVDSTSISLAWSDVYGATLYDVQVSTSPTFTSDVTSRFDLYGTQTKLGPLRSATAYYWRVLGRSDFATGTWSDTAAFVTAAPQGKGLSPLLPLLGSVDVPVQGSVRYSTSRIYTSYRLELSKSPTFDPLVSTFTSDNGTCAYRDLERETTYFWRVRGSRDGKPSDVGTAAYFTTERKAVVSVNDETSNGSSVVVRREGSRVIVNAPSFANSLSSVQVFDLQGRLLAQSTANIDGLFVVDVPLLGVPRTLFLRVASDEGAICTSTFVWN